VNVAVVNLSPSVSEDDAKRLAEGLQLYADRVCAAWDRKPVQIEYVAGARAAPDGWIGLVIFDKPSEPGFLGYHAVDSHGRPYGRAFLDVVPNRTIFRDPSGQGASLAGTLTHELAELVADLYANLYADLDVTDQASGKTYHAVAFELCDGVQETAFAMQLKDGTVMDGSNFAWPDYFNPRAPTSARFDEMELATRPGHLLPGGYLIVRDVLDDSNLFARKVLHPVPPAPWRAAMRNGDHSRTHRRLNG
jgi:hypothetical protein